MDRYVVDIDQEDKEELFNKARIHFTRNKDFQQAINLDKDTLKEHKEGDTNAIGLDILDSLIRIIDRTSPIFDLYEPEKYIESRSNYRGEERVDLQDDFQTFLFEPYTIKELEEMTGKSEQTLVKYRNNTLKTVPVKIYEEVLNDIQKRFGVKDKDQKEQNKSENNFFEGELHLRGTHNNGYADREDSFITEVTEKEIKKVKNLRESLYELEKEGNIALGRLKSYFEPGFNKLKQELEDNRLLIKAKGEREGEFFHALSELDLAKKWGGNASPWELTEEPFMYEILENEILDSLKPNENSSGQNNEAYSKSELICILNEASEDYGGTPTLSWIDTHEDYPSQKPFINHFGEWNTALWMAGLEPNRERFDEEIMAEEFLKLEQELGRVPETQDLDDYSDILSTKSIENRFGGYKNLLRETGLYTKWKLENREADIEKWYAETEYYNNADSGELFSQQA